jgi:hypothetical protein
MPHLSFPSDINSSKDIFLMYPVDFTVETTQRGVNSRKIPSTGDSVSLPTPAEGITLTETGQWEETAGYQNLSGAAIGAAGKAVMDGLGPAGKITVGKGKFINDYASLSYSGSNFRTYSFSWELLPSSLAEAQAIAEIIKVVRVNSLPNYSGADKAGRLTYPKMWKVYPAMKTEIGLFLKDCVITSVTVNYTPDGVLRLFKSGHPVSVNLALEFQELYRAEKGDVQ